MMETAAAHEILRQARLRYGAFHADSKLQAIVRVCKWQDKMRKYFQPRSFRFYAKLVILSARLCKQSFDNLSRAWNDHESALNGLDHYDAKVSWRGLAFRMQDFKAKPEILAALTKITAFSGYPKKMQRQLCQVGRFESYEPKRVVVREGDQPHSFYFILSGVVLVSGCENEAATPGEIMMLAKGMSFGELAVISHTRRKSTVCSKTDVELLSISGPDFEEIFMTRGQDISAPETRQFMRNVTFLRHWPIEELSSNFQACTVYNFDRNQVLVRDSNNSDWIYLVLKGSLSVIKKLKRMESITTRKRYRASLKELEQRYGSRGQKSDKWPRRTDKCYATASLRDTPIQSLPLSLSICHDTFQSTHELETRLEQSLPGYHNHAERCGCLDYNQIISSFHSRLVAKGHVVGSGVTIDCENCLSMDGRIDTEDARQNEAIRRNSLNSYTEDYISTIRVPQPIKSFCLPSIAHHDKPTKDNPNYGKGSTSNQIRNENCNKKKDEAADDRVLYSNHKRDSSKAGDSRGSVNKPSLEPFITSGTHRVEKWDPRASRPDQDNVTSDVRDGTGEKRTDHRDKLTYRKIVKEQIHSERSKRVVKELANDDMSNIRHTETNLNQTVLELQVLERGQYFGVSSLLFPDQPSLSVVSNGAECLVMSKTFFQQFASDKCLRHLRLTECPYPSDLELHVKLQETVNWQSVRSGVYQQVCEQIGRRKRNRKQFVPAYKGQYCFRAGPI